MRAGFAGVRLSEAADERYDRIRPLLSNYGYNNYCVWLKEEAGG